ncbi:MAG TPA: hypothetical protein VMZ52_15790 [Bryobacteraceae bacterium]|nr:hypothetical protein [Bryobacteraceae bacterium]
MNSNTVILSMIGAILLGCAVLQGVNPLDKFFKGLLWLLYQAASIVLAVARTSECAYLTLQREYRKSVAQLNAERAALRTLEEMNSTPADPSHSTAAAPMFVR